MITGLHILLTYRCIFECDHCFVYSSPNAKGTFNLPQMRDVLDQAEQVGTIEIVYFEGGEPFLFYPLLLESIRLARAKGFRVGIVSNAFYADSEANAELYLRPLVELGICDLSISDDALHDSAAPDSHAKQARAVAQRLGLPVDTISISEPTVEVVPDPSHAKGAPVVGGDVMFRGRAADRLATDLPMRPAAELTTCPYEDLAHPGRVHLDPYGYIHLCQGLCMGNIWQTPLPELLKQYDPAAHPIAGPLLRGGPARLAEEYAVPHAGQFVDECHLCYTARRALLERFPDVLAPRQVYGLD